MNIFSQARLNMVEGQLRAGGVFNEKILEQFGTIPREFFLPGNLHHAYIDEDLKVNNKGIFLLEPLVHGRMVQAAEPGPDDIVLNCGDLTGYSSAIFANLVSTVVTLENELADPEKMRRAWEKLDLVNIAGIRSNITEGCPAHAPYNIIFINGAVPEIPSNLLEQLADGGRLVAVVREAGKAMGDIILVERQSAGCYSRYNVANAATWYVPGFEPQPVFEL